MLRRLAFLPFLIVAGAIGFGLFGCSQSEDIVTPVSSTEISLSAERLPALPDGMLYELWVADNSDTVSLGKFGWDNVNRRFLNADGDEITGSFALKDDILKYRSCFVTVETDPDDNTASPGPIIVIDNVTNTAENAITMRFPKVDSLWLNNAVFNLEATSDTTRDGHNGCGVWFATYGRLAVNIRDTFGVVFDSLPEFDTFIDPGSTAHIPNELLSYSVDTTTIALPGPNFVLRFPDADAQLQHIGVSFTLGYFDTTIPDTPIGTPYNYHGLKINADVPDALRPQRTLNYDFFISEDEIFPDISMYGWKYKGWVLTPYLNSVAMSTRWRFTPPAYPYKIGGMNLFPGDTGVLFTTGAFSSILNPDESDPFSLANPRAPFPGEDFLNKPAMQAAFGIDSVNLLPNETGNIGCVFISLEPNNHVFDTTNFPLIVTASDLPSARSQMIPAGIAPLAFRMRPWTGSVMGDTYGFPVIYVTITRR
jgi:hypothetical protein